MPKEVWHKIVYCNKYKGIKWVLQCNTESYRYQSQQFIL